MTMTMMMNTRRLLMMLQKTTSSPAWKITDTAGGGIGGVRRGGNKTFGSTASLINRFDPPPMAATVSYHDVDSSLSSIGAPFWTKTTTTTKTTKPWTFAHTLRYKSTMVVQPDLDDDNDDDNVIEMEKAAEAVVAHKCTSTFTPTTTAAAHDQSITQPFPSLVIGPDRSIQPQGSFAEAQAQFLDPDLEMVERLCDGLLATNMGVVAHYYMDVELQGVLQALKESHPLLQNRIGIADSLKMGDIAVDMCKNHGVEHVVCLGVDFMAESVQAILQKNGLGNVPVYRAKPQAIGCSLAESAEGIEYHAWLQMESAKATADGCNPLHVIYINTSLKTKAESSSLVPTITCTSSNVLQTLLQASSEIGNLRILYGPDTYMGENLQRLLEVIVDSDDWTDAKIASDLHPGHTKDSLRALRDNLRIFPQGNCVVHHMFGQSVVNSVKGSYSEKPDTYVTAHLEVPGEMFEIAMTKSLDDKGVVGSTSDILTFISRKVQEGVENQSSNRSIRRLRFVLGTEAGMVTSIVKKVQDILQQTGNPMVEAEIIFPVSSEAVMSTDGIDGDMPVVPGVVGGEGCSTAGGCATCPFMKMNDLDALEDIIDMVGSDTMHSSSTLKRLLPPDRLSGKAIGGVDAVALGTEAILYMREFMQTKTMPDQLVKKVKEFELNGKK